MAKAHERSRDTLQCKKILLVILTKLNEKLTHVSLNVKEEVDVIIHIHHVLVKKKDARAIMNMATLLTAKSLVLW